MTTPMMQQYQEAKQRHPGMLLFFRNGDFYELFEEDAELGAKLLGITLTRRDKLIPMAGVPYHALDRYLARLLRAGHRVAVCEQMEDASQAKGIIRREVTRVVTPGTLTEEELLDPRQANHLVSVFPPAGRKTTFGLAWVDLSTGLFQACDAPTLRLEDELARLQPSECLLPDDDTTGIAARIQHAFPNTTVTPRFDWTYDIPSARAALFNHFGVSTLAGFGFDDEQPCLTAAGALLLYLRETVRASLSHLSRLRPYRHERYLTLDEVTRRSLELTHTMREGERAGSLLSVLDRTVTPMGGRLLAEWLNSPLADLRAIETRLDGVTELMEEVSLRHELQELLKDALDLQRLTARASTGRGTPRDLGAVLRTLRMLPRVKAKIAARRSPLLRELESRLELCPELREVLEAALEDNLPGSSKEGKIIRRGYDVDLDAEYEITTQGREWMTRLQAEETTRTNIPSLKVGYNQIDGYYLEITHTHQAKVPAHYQHRKTLKNATRYVTPELLERADRVLGAQERLEQREHELFLGLRDKVSAQTPRLLAAGEILATLDVLASLAELAVSRNYCRPRFVEGKELHLVEGRHPVLDQTLPPGTLVPNDVALGGESGMMLLITGPNMAGKSIYIRQVALITLLAHMGSYVPAQQATLGLVDRIFTRVGASDEISRGQSTFMVEMTEAANILNNATDRSLVILDEIGRGTSTYDGVSLAWAITEYLHDVIGCRALFATHYHELAELEEKLPRLRNGNVQVHEGADGIVFLHKLGPGSADKSYGIHVAQLAGIPPEILARARLVLAELESRHVAAPERVVTHGPKKPRLVEPSLFANSEDPVLQALREVDLNKLTPEEAMKSLRRWQRELRVSF